MLNIDIIETKKELRKNVTCMIVFHNDKKIHSFTSDYSLTFMTEIKTKIENAYNGEKILLSKTTKGLHKRHGEKHLIHFNNCIEQAYQDGVSDRS